MIVTLSCRSGSGRISGLLMEATGFPAVMDSRSPRANRGDGFESQGCYRAWCGVGPADGPSSYHSLSISVLADSVARPSLDRHRVGKWQVAVPYGPDDASQFIGDRKGGFVMSSPLLESQRPLLQPRQGLGRRGASVRRV